MKHRVLFKELTGGAIAEHGECLEGLRKTVAGRHRRRYLIAEAGRLRLED